LVLEIRKRENILNFLKNGENIVKKEIKKKMLNLFRIDLNKGKWLKKVIV